MIANKTQLIFTGVTALLLMLLYFFIDARTSALFPKCPFYLLTRLFCPGCGSQRAVSSLLHGELIQAARFNVLLVISLPLILYSAGVAVLNSVNKKQLVQYLFYSPVFVKIYLGLLLVFWLLRNIPVYPFTLLAPK